MTSSEMNQTVPGASSEADAVDLTPTGNTVVVGLQWGDEGKGQLVDVFSERFDLIARYNGGNNAGHSVHIGKQKFALHLIPSGILHAEKINVIGNGLVVDPSPETGILKEIDGLRDRGVKVEDNLRISSRAHVVLSYHKLQDALWDQALGMSRGDDQKIGTTGRGIGPCYADKALRSTAIRMGDLLDRDRLREKLTHIVVVKNAILAALAERCEQSWTPLDADALTDEYSQYGERLRQHICDTRELLQQAVDAGGRVLFEGANAALLDVDHGTYPFVTSSSCSSLGVGTGTGIPGRHLQSIVGVAKAYVSRVGGGPHPTEQDDEVGEHLCNVGHEFGTTTGRPRRCGWLDLTAVRYSAQINGCTSLACTGLSVLSGLDPVRVCVGYDYDGKRYDTFPPDADVLAKATPIYETLDGFSAPTGEVRSFEQLPDAAKAYIHRIETFVGVPVHYVCVGRRRDQILTRRSSLTDLPSTD